MQQVNINNKPVQFPTVAADVSLKQFFDLRKATNVIQEICAVTGLKQSEVKNFNSMSSINTAIHLMNVLGADILAMDAIKLPDYVYIGVKKIKVPKALHLEPIGAYMSVHSILADQENKIIKEGKDRDFTDCIPLTLAHYFYKYYNPDTIEYSDEAAEGPDYMNLIMNIPITQAMPIGNFFFLKFPDLP